MAALVSGCRAGKPPPPDVPAGLAFARTDGQRYSIWVAQADGSQAREIAAHAFAGTLSPDGRRLAYSLHQRRPGSGVTPLYVVELVGGKSRLIGEARGFDWSPDSTRLAVAGRKGLFLVDVRSGRLDLVRDENVSGVRFASDGKALVYASANGLSGHEYRSDIFVIRFSGGSITQLTHDGHSDMPVWGNRWVVYRHFRFEIHDEFSIGELHLMRPDGRDKRRFARGDENRSKAHFGLDPLDLSADGKRLLACAAAEFDCSPVTFTVPDGKKYKLPIEADRSVVRRGELAYATDLSRDGSEVLVDVGPFDGAANHRVYAIPFEGGKPRLLVRDATAPRWAH